MRRGGLVICLATCLGAAPALAATVRGTVTLPPEPRTLDTRDGHWRVENGILPIAPRVPDPRTEVVVTLEGGPDAERTDKPAPPPVTVELHGLRLDPKVAVAEVGASITFKNSDRVPHTLYFENADSLLPPAPLPSGQSRSVTLHAAASYRVRDEEFPHVQGTVVVVETPHAAIVDDKGAFKLDVPEGKYTLKLYWRGNWVMSQPLDVSAKTTEVALTVPAGAAPLQHQTAAAPAPAPTSHAPAKTKPNAKGQAQ